MKAVRDLIAAVDPERLRADVRFLAADPLPCRTLTHTIPGHAECTLYEADDFIEQRLEKYGYRIDRQRVPVQAFVSDPTVSWGFRKPLEHEPWYSAVNLLAVHRGRTSPSDHVVLVAHKDSQSWLDRGPGAYDNAVGVAALLEIARLLVRHELECSVTFLFCNEEHWPWTSVAAAESLSRSRINIRAVLNIDSIGGKALLGEGTGRYPNVIRFSTDEGKHLADRIGELNQLFGIGIAHSTVRVDIPNDDDGSFVNAGILPSVLFIGSYPYADPNYHTVADTADNVDFENVRRATQIALATVVTIGDSQT